MLIPGHVPGLRCKFLLEHMLGQGHCSDVFIFFGRGSPEEDLSKQGEKEIDEESQERVLMKKAMKGCVPWLGNLCANQAPSSGNPVRHCEITLRLPLLWKLAFINSPYDLNNHCQVLHHALC